MPCSVTYEFPVIRWANSGSSCARGFCPHARDEEGEKTALVEKKWNIEKGRKKSRGSRAEAENKAGKTTGADGGCAGAKWKKFMREWTPR